MKKFLIKTIWPLLRGTVKSVPVIGTFLYEFATYLMFNDKVKAGEVSEKFKHNPKSLIMQGLSAIALILCWAMDIITVDDVVKFLNMLKVE